MLFRQFVDDDLGCASYLIGDEDSGEAVVVDPAYAIEDYLEQAERDGVRIVRVLETHTHADHVSGHGRLALEHGLPISIHPAADPAYPFDPLEDGRTIELGQVAIRVLHTPGHRPEHCCFEVIDREKEMVRLGSGGLDGKKLTQEAMSSTLQALSKFVRLAQSHQVDEMLAALVGLTHLDAGRRR